MSPTARVVTRTALRFLTDATLLGVAYIMAFHVHTDFIYTSHNAARWQHTWPIVVAAKYLLLVRFRATSHSWRYTTYRDLAAIVAAAVAGTLALAVVSAVATPDVLPPIGGDFATIPAGVIAIDLLATILLLCGARGVWMAVVEAHYANKRRTGEPAKRTILVGAGDAGVLVAKELVRRPDLGMRPVGFVDDDVMKQNRLVSGLRVLGRPGELEDIVQRTGAEQVLITIAHPPARMIREVTDACEVASVPVRTIPGLYEVVEGPVNLTRLRPVQIEDLLRRDPVSEGSDLVDGIVRGATILVTGAGGSIGSELCRQLVRHRPSALALLERSENALYEIHRELSADPAAEEVRLIPLVTDIVDADAVRHEITSLRPDVVFHAAAHKHVPMMEALPLEAVRNNVLGSKSVIDACVEAGVPRVVVVSTDKAVNPTSVMGATKRVVEQYLQQAAAGTSRQFVAVRFGNVLASSGSVIPLFQEQIAAGGPVTVTHPEMRRYFMTIPEACRLVMEAGAMADGGEVFVLDMGDPVRIVDLARDLIRLSGLRPDEDIPIAFVGLRPGEKLFEELGLASEEVHRTAHPRIHRWAPRDAGASDVHGGIERLRAAVEAHDVTAARTLLRDMVPEYTPEAVHRSDAPSTVG